MNTDKIILASRHDYKGVAPLGTRVVRRRMNFQILTIIFLLVGPVGHAAEPSIESRWIENDLPLSERDALVEASKNEPFEKIAPIVLAVLIEPPQNMPGYYGDKPWNADHLSSESRKYLMAAAVWSDVLEPKDDRAKAEILLALLQEASSPVEAKILIHAIRWSHWFTDAEPVLADIASNKERALHLRLNSVIALLGRCDINRYMPLALEIVRLTNEGMPRSQAFSDATNLGNRLYTLTYANREAVLSSGFDILKRLSDEDLRHGYFVALDLGFILKIEDDFKPNQREEKYQGEHGLADEFFEDTVRNALAWYSKNMAENGATNESL